VAVVEYNNPEDKFGKEEPTISQTIMNKKGVLALRFNQNIEFPESFKSKLENDKEPDPAKRKLSALPGMKLFYKNANSVTPKRISNSAIILKVAEGKNVDI